MQTQPEDKHPGKQTSKLYTCMGTEHLQIPSAAVWCSFSACWIGSDPVLVPEKRTQDFGAQGCAVPQNLEMHRERRG